MIQEIRLMPRTAESYPFASAEGKLGFGEHGYKEEEYFFRGTSDVYEETGRHEKKVIHAENPYANRLLVRRPEDMENFSGDIVVEILNATAGFDLDRMWVLCGKELMRSGAVYVGITSKPDMLDALRLFDPERYEELTWEVSYEIEQQYEPENILLKLKHLECETGLFWDMLRDAAAELKEGSRLLKTEKKRYLYLFGWSQSANYISTYIRYFHDQDKIFDGYLSAGGVHHFVTPLHQGEVGKPMDVSLTKIERMPVPYIAVQTETENADFGGYECRQENSDAEDMKYRIYELAGATHDTKFSLLDYYENDEKMRKIGLIPRYGGEGILPNDYPYQYLMYGICRYLFHWVKNGILPPRAERIHLDEQKKNRRDEYGNVIGGVRLPLLDHPLCTYCPTSVVRMEDGTEAVNPVFGHEEVFPEEQLVKMYGSLGYYREKITEKLQKLVGDGYLLNEDQEELIHYAVRKAEEAGLR